MADSDRHGDLDEEDRFEDEGRRSIFSALWFRAILVVVVLGVVAAVAVPYLLEWANPQPPQPTAASRPGDMASPSAAPPPAKSSGGGAYVVQVGAFKDPDAARRLAARLRELKFDVDESMLRGAPTAKAPAAPSASAPTTGSDKYDVYVSGGVPAEINA